MNPVMLVSGGSRGIGAACCRLAARDGFDVAINYRTRAEEAEKVAEAVRRQGRRALTVQADLVDPLAITAMFDRVEAELGPVRAFVSNGGVIHRSAPIADLTFEEIKRVVDVDLTSHIAACGEAVRRMSTKRGGRGGNIVIMSSAASRTYGAGGLVPYATTKAGTDALTIGLAREVGDQGIRVNALRPGLIETDIHQDTGEADRLGRLSPGVPMARTGTADEVAEAVMWLVSPAASYVTAALLDVTGGR